MEDIFLIFPEELPERFVDDYILKLAVLQKDTIRRGIHKGPISLLACPQRVFHFLAVSNIFYGSFVVEGLAVAVPHCPGIERNPRLIAVFLVYLFLEPFDRTLLLTEGLKSFAVFGVNIELLPYVRIGCHEFLGGPEPVHLCKGSVRGNDLSCRRGLEDALNCVFEDTAIFFFTYLKLVFRILSFAHVPDDSLKEDCILVYFDRSP